MHLESRITPNIRSTDCGVPYWILRYSIFPIQFEWLGLDSRTPLLLNVSEIIRVTFDNRQRKLLIGTKGDPSPNARTSHNVAQSRGSGDFKHCHRDMTAEEAKFSSYLRHGKDSFMDVPCWSLIQKISKAQDKRQEVWKLGVANPYHTSFRANILSAPTINIVTATTAYPTIKKVG